MEKINGHTEEEAKSLVEYIYNGKPATNEEIELKNLLFTIAITTE